MEKPVTISSSLEEKAGVCKDSGAIWAFEHEGRYYCFIEDERTPCAGSKSVILKRRLYSANRGWRGVEARYYECLIANKINMENRNGRRKER